MTRHVRSWALAALAVFALSGASTPSLAGITYNVTNDTAHQNGWSLAGTITVSSIGTFSNADPITAWNITATNGSTSYLFANTLSGASKIFNKSNGTSNNIIATDSTLSLNNARLFLSADAGDTTILRWTNAWNYGFGPLTGYSASGSSNSLWDSPSFSPSVGGAWTLGTAPAPVPEIAPATGGSALSLVAGVLAVIEQRRRRATRVA